MSYSKNIRSLLIIGFTILLFSCSTPKILFSVSQGKQLDKDTREVLVNRGGKELSGKKDLKLKEGDVININNSVQGTSIKSFQTFTTVHGSSTLVVNKENLEQKSGTAIHEAKEGKLIIPDISISHAGASYLVVIEEKTIELIVFDGQILVSPTLAKPAWKPFNLKSRQRKKIWRDGRLSPNQPLTPDDLNKWINSENKILKDGNSNSRMIPSVITLPSEDAKGLVSSSDFSVSLKYTEEGDGQLGTITVQQPKGGRRVDAKTSVTIYERSRQVKIPEVLGMSYGAAKYALEEAGLKVRNGGETITRSVPENKINSQKPFAGELAAEGSTVTINVEAVAVKVPIIVDQSVEQARKTLEGLKLEIVNSNYDLNYNGTPKVISQEPKQGTYVLPFSTVKVGRQVKGFQVPDVTGLTESKATSTIIEAELSVGQTIYKKSEKVEKGLVISQSLKEGSLTEKGTKVILTISSGK